MANERLGIELPPPPEGKPRRSPPWVVVLVVAVVIVGVGVVRAIAFLGEEADDEPGSSLLLDEDFVGQGPYEFVEEQDAFVRLEATDGAYDILIMDASLAQPITHTFLDEVDAIRFEATVTQTTRSGFHTFFSLGCWDGETMYGITLSSDRRLLVSTAETDPDTFDRSPVGRSIHHPAVQAAGQPNTVRIDCAGANGDHPATIHGWVNRTPVLSVEVPHGPDSFNRVGFLIETLGDGTEFRVDDVTARASREAAPTLVAPEDLTWGTTPQRFERAGVGFSFPPDWVILDGESADSFSVGPKPGVNWVKLASGPAPFSVSGLDALEDHLQHANRLVRVFGGRIASPPSPTEIAGLPAYGLSVSDIELKDGQIVDAEALLIFSQGTLHVLIGQYEPSARAEVLNAWNLAKETFHAPVATPTPTCQGKAATIVGTWGDDELTGTYREDVIVGLGGADVIRARDGGDTVCGGGGNDTVYADWGADRVVGNTGNDTLNGYYGDDTLDGGAGLDSLNGGGGTDICVRGENVSRCEAKKRIRLDWAHREPAPHGEPAV
jgi:RTX calcium-binding nonapeptide repeat (4 copies)